MARKGAALVEPLRPEDPRQLGVYWLAGRVGEGGYGVVFEGYDPAGARVAVKMLKGDTTAEALRELRMLIRVDQSCTARVIAADFDHSPAYVVSEFIAGPDLKSWIKKNGPYGPASVYRLGLDLARALAPIHKVGITHRDLKPANILLEPDGPKVIDFGLARAQDMTLSANQIKGTPLYMAPEVWRNAPATPAVDVWAWGAIILFAATGRDSFRGGDIYAIRHRIINADPSFGALTEPLRSLVAQALSKDPRRRPTADQLLAALTESAPPAGAPEPELLPAEAVAQSAAQKAELTYTHLSEEEQAVVPGMLLRMVTGSTDPEDALRTAEFAEFQNAEAHDSVTHVQTTRRVLDRLCSDGAVVRNDVGYTLAAPALLRGWSRLGAWVEEDRPVLGLHHDLATAARRWQEHGRKDGDLLQGSPLDLAVEQAVAVPHHLKLNHLERDYYDRSVAAVHRRSRVRSAVTATLAVLLAIAIGAAVTAVTQSRTVAEQRDQAVGARAANVAAAMRRTDPVIAKQLGVAAAALAPEAMETRSTLLALRNQPEQFTYVPPGVDGTWKPGGDKTGRVVVYAKGQDVKVVDVDARKVTVSFTVPGQILRAVRLTDDGRIAALTNDDGKTSLWDTTTGRPWPSPLRPESWTSFLSPRGTYFLTGGDVRGHRGKDVMSLLEVKTGKRVLKIPHLATYAAMSADETILYLIDDKWFEQWDVSSGKRVVRGGGNAPFTGFDVSPDGRVVALRQKERLLLMRDGKHTKIPTLRIPAVYRSGRGNVDFSSDGRYVVVDGAVFDVGSLWDPKLTPRWDPVASYSTPGCFDVTFGPNDRTLRCFDFDGAVKVFAFGPVTDLVEAGVPSYFTLLSADGSTLTRNRIIDGLEIWDTVHQTKRGTVPSLNYFSGGTAALSRDGRQLAAFENNDAIIVWDVATGAKKFTTPPRKGFSTNQVRIGFSPDGRTLAVNSRPIGADTTTLEVWDLTTGAQRFASPGDKASIPADEVPRTWPICSARTGRP